MVFNFPSLRPSWKSSSGSMWTTRLENSGWSWTWPAPTAVTRWGSLSHYLTLCQWLRSLLLTRIKTRCSKNSPLPSPASATWWTSPRPRWRRRRSPWKGRSGSSRRLLAEARWSSAFSVYILSFYVTKTLFRFQVLRNQATFLGNKLEMFSTTYLGLEWKTFRAWNLFKILQLVAICGPPALYIYIMPSYWTTLCYWAYQSSVICSPYVAIDQIFRRMNLSALVLHLSWAVPDIFASCVSNGIHSVSIKYTSLFNTEYFLLLPVSRASEYGISLFEIY